LPVTGGSKPPGSGEERVGGKKKTPVNRIGTERDTWGKVSKIEENQGTRNSEPGSFPWLRPSNFRKSGGCQGENLE